MGADSAKKGEQPMIAKVFVAVALAIVCTLELAFAIWDYKRKK